MKINFLLTLLLVSSMLTAQTKTSDAPAPAAPSVKEAPVVDPQTFGQLISADRIKTMVNDLASPKMQGRETGQPGQREAAAYIAAEFKNLGLPAVADRNTYFQQIVLEKTAWRDIGLKVDGRDFQNREDFYVFAGNNPDNPMLSVKEVVFVGYGIEDEKYNDYGRTDVKGKAVVFYDGEPLNADGKSLITGKDFRSSWSLDWRRKVKLAADKGATVVFIIDPKIAENLTKNRRLISSSGWRPVSTEGRGQAAEKINSLFVSPAVAAALLGKKSGKAEDALAELRTGGGFKPVKVKTAVEIRLDKESTRLEGSNVIGFIEGSDSLLKKEYVFVTAHYDHLGMSDSTRIFYGADDNASGTAAVIEIARAFAEAKKRGVGPKRSVVCMLVSGEEKGLLGSKFYVDFPIFSLENTVVDINIDMVGRIDDAHANNPDYVYVIGSDRLSTVLHKINEEVNTRYTKLELDYRYNAKDDPNHYYERSDHYNFAERGIPAIFYFNGTHPDYHRTTDTPDKINTAAAAKRAQLAFYTAWEIANRPKRLPVDVK